MDTGESPDDQATHMETTTTCSGLGQNPVITARRKNSRHFRRVEPLSTVYQIESYATHSDTWRREAFAPQTTLTDVRKQFCDIIMAYPNLKLRIVRITKEVVK